MAASSIFITLIDWTPFLAAGFLRNLLIAILAMIFGTVIGVGLGRLRQGRIQIAGAAAGGLTSLARNVPSFVLMFYVAFLLPVEVSFEDTVFQFPTWIKATIALTIPVVGFASDQFKGYIRQKQEGIASAAPMFWVAWVQYFLIILMASSTASVIGADEIVGRANRVVATDNDPALLIATYAYVAIWFLVAGSLVSRYGPRLAKRLTKKGA